MTSHQRSSQISLCLEPASANPNSRASIRSAPQAKQAKLAPATRSLLTGMMKSSKLSNLQQKFLDTIVSSGQSLPPLAKINSFRELDAASRHASRAADVNEWYNKPHAMRTRAQIVTDGAYIVPQYRTQPMKNMMAEKTKFQDLLIGIDQDSDCFSKQHHTRLMSIFRLISRRFVFQ